MRCIEVIARELGVLTLSLSLPPSLPLRLSLTR